MPSTWKFLAKGIVRIYCNKVIHKEIRSETLPVSEEQSHDWTTISMTGSVGHRVKIQKITPVVANELMHD
jgi:hypothetical protein